MANLVYSVGLPDFDWQAALLDALINGEFQNIALNQTSVVLKSGQNEITIVGTNLDISGVRQIDAGSITSVTLTSDGTTVAVAHNYTVARTFSDLQVLLDADLSSFDGIYQAVYALFAPEAMNITGSSASDILFGSVLNDTITGGADRDIIIAGAGDDTIYADEDGPLWWGDYIVPGLGNNTIIATAVIHPNGYRDGHDLAFWDLQSGVTINIANGVATATGMHTTFSEVGYVAGTGLADVMIGGGQSDQEGFSGNAGNDTINGKGGNDKVDYNEEVITGYQDEFGAWHRGLQGAVVDLANNTATDTFGDTDSLFNIEDVSGTDFADKITGDDASNRLEGRGGKDKIDGGKGKDTMEGGAGNDTYILDNSGDVINDTAGRDLVKSANQSIKLNSTKIKGVENATLTGNASNSLSGDAGKNKLIGNDGMNRIDGRKGNDILKGGKKADTFVFKTNYDMDKVLDFDATGRQHDILDLRGLKSVNNYNDLITNHMEKSGKNVVIDGGKGDEITLKNVKLNDLDAGDFLI